METAEALDRLRERTGVDAPLHVDAAIGGFIAPFTDPGRVWDFRLPRIASINASGRNRSWRGRAQDPVDPSA